jgi:hypothetical protein
LACAGLVRGPFDTGAKPSLVATAVRLAHGRPVLAAPAVAEQVADAGGRVVVSNPIDAFPRRYQRLYLDWLQGRPSADAVVRASGVVIAARGSEDAIRLSRRTDFVAVARDDAQTLFVRRGAG